MNDDAITTVFGGTGFLGREIVRALLASGQRVRVAARRPDAPGLDDVTVERVVADIRYESAVARAVDGAAAAVNAVSLYVEKRDATFEAVHVRGAETIARCARQAGLERLVHISGIGVDTASPSPYIRARALGEDRTRETFPEATILRPSVLFGPGDAFLSALKGVTLLPVIPLFGSGRTRLQPVYVDDVAAAVVAALERPDSAGRVFELGGAGIHSYRDILRAVLRELGRRRLLMPVPFAVWKLLAGLMSILPSPPLTRDQIVLMEDDNLVGPNAAGFAELGIEPYDLEGQLASLLRPRG